MAGCFGWELCKDYKKLICIFTKSVERLQIYAKVSCNGIHSCLKFALAGSSQGEDNHSLEVAYGLCTSGTPPQPDGHRSWGGM